VVTDALEAALSQRDDLDQYKSAKRTLFALQLTLDLEDVHSVAATALTDGPDDKSCDLVYVDRDSGSVIIAQGYEATKVNQLQAPLVKASTLHQAVNWLFAAQQESEVPQRLRSAWKELHEALADDAIDEIEIWFVHNLPESVQNRTELDAVAQATYGLVSARYGSHPITVTATELGRTTLSDRYEGSRTPILVTDEFTIDTHGAFTEHGDNCTNNLPSIERDCSQPTSADILAAPDHKATSTTESRRPHGMPLDNFGRTTTASLRSSTTLRQTSHKTL
jgi:hypothetical protein